VSGGRPSAPAGTRRLAWFVRPHDLFVIRTVGSFFVSALLGAAIPFAALFILGHVTLAVMLPNAPPWVRDHLSVSILAIQLLAWLPPVLVSVLIIRLIGAVYPAVLGVIASLVAIATLFVAVALSPERSLADAVSLFWREALLLLVFLPIACVLQVKRAA